MEFANLLFVEMVKKIGTKLAMMEIYKDMMDVRLIV
jgi:hypothetical protein